MQVFFAPPKPDEGDGEIIDWVEEEDEGGYMTPPTDAQQPAGLLIMCLPLLRHSMATNCLDRKILCRQSSEASACASCTCWGHPA